MTSYTRTALLFLGLLAAATGAAQGQQQSPERGVAAAQGTAPTARPGDRVALRIWNEPEMSDTFNISETGQVILPKLGSVYVVNLPIPTLQDSLRRAYAVYLRNPSVEVTVLRRVGIQGEIRNPGIYLADLTMALPDLLAMAGGLNQVGNPNNILIVRGSQRIRYRSRDQSQFLVAQLQSGDQVFVRPKSVLQRNPVGTVTGAVTLATTIFGVVVPMIRRAFEKKEGT